jgi:phosphonate transport system substrate-binding protein
LSSPRKRDAGDYEDLEAGDHDQLTVLARTTSVPRHVVLARPGMGEAIRVRITEPLLSPHETPEEPEILETFERTSQFDALPQAPEGTMEALQELFAPMR